MGAKNIEKTSQKKIRARRKDKSQYTTKEEISKMQISRQKMKIAIRKRLQRESNFLPRKARDTAILNSTIESEELFLIS